MGCGPARLNGDGTQVSDETLVTRAAVLGDVSAFEMLVRRHERRIFYVLLRFTRNRALAEDLCQETFLRAWRKLSTFEASGSFGGWLARLAYNVFLADHRLARTTAEVTCDDPEAVRSRAGEVTPDLEMPDLDRLLSAVSPSEQQLLVLSYAAGLSAGEIGEMLGLSAGTVKSQIHRAKQKIRQRFAIGEPT